MKIYNGNKENTVWKGASILNKVKNNSFTISKAQYEE